MMINIVTAIENAHVDILRAVITKSSKSTPKAINTSSLSTSDFLTHATHS
ncbi:hypothetical protein [Coleofasciculus sp. FACHB-SPT36]|nr:hypothetical protein [Coleofasciculus sp. FACHB-SPT36]MBD2540452.1 hypothetical protein [Coleofasciculus sp. FACHB-SPT36]